MYRRRLVLGLLCAVLVFVLSFLALFAFLPRSYTVSKAFVFSAAQTEGGEADFLSSLLSTRFFHEASYSQQVAKQVIEANDLPYTSEELLSKISVEYSGEGLLLHLGATMPTKEQASTVLDAYAQGLFSTFGDRFFQFEARCLPGEELTLRNPLSQTVLLSVLCAVAAFVTLAWSPICYAYKKCSRRLFSASSSMTPLQRRRFLHRHLKRLGVLFLCCVLLLGTGANFLFPRQYEAVAATMLESEEDETTIIKRFFCSSAFSVLNEPVFFTLFYDSLPQDLQARYSKQEIEKSITCSADTSIELGVLHVTCLTDDSADAARICQLFVDFFMTTVAEWYPAGRHTVIAVPFVTTKINYAAPAVFVLAISVFVCYLYYALLYKRACRARMSLPAPKTALLSDGKEKSTD